MGLSKEQEEEMYKTTLETAKDISWIREQFQEYEATQKEQEGRIQDLEVEHSLLKGKLGAFILGLTFIISLLVNGILWAWTHLGSK